MGHLIGNTWLVVITALVCSWAGIAFATPSVMTGRQVEVANANYYDFKYNRASVSPFYLNP
jgi:hypothetical protein